MIILINGKKRAGKDTFGEILNELLPEAKRKSFAAPIKDIVSKCFGVSLDKLDYFKNDESIRIGFRSPNESMCTQRNTRQFLQVFGTDAMKPYFGDSVWGDLLLKDFISEPEEPIYIVTDFRYPEELEPLINYDGTDIVTVYVQRDEAENSEDSHSSENALNDFVFDYTIDNNGTVEDLRVEAIQFVDALMNK